jgi:hypothetical protein
MAGRSVANLAASVTANTRGFDRGMRSAQSSLMPLVKAVAAAGAVATGAVAGFALFFNATSKTIDEQAKLAQRMQLTNREFQTFRLAAERGGTSVEAFGKAAKALATTTFDALEQGTARNVMMFNKLGISQEELRELSKDQVALFTRVTEALGGLESATERAAIGSALLGRNYTELIPALKDGALKSAAEDARLFGLVLAQDATKNIENLRDRMGDLGKRWQGFATQLVSSLSGPVLAAITKFGEWIDGIIEQQGGMAQVAGNVAKVIIRAIGAIIEALSGFINKIDEVIGRWEDFQKRFTVAGAARGVGRGMLAPLRAIESVTGTDLAERILPGPQERESRFDPEAIRNWTKELEKSVTTMVEANKRAGEVPPPAPERRLADERDLEVTDPALIAESREQTGLLRQLIAVQREPVTESFF